MSQRQRTEDGIPLRRTDIRATDTAESPRDRAALAALFRLGSAREWIGRLGASDALDLHRRVRVAALDQALLLDPARLERRALARCAHAGIYAPPGDDPPALEAWVRARIDEAIEDLLAEDDDGLFDGQPAVSSEPFVGLARRLKLDPEALADRCRRFNRLEESVRRAFCASLYAGRAVETLSDDELGPGGVVAFRRRLRLACDVLLGGDDA